MKPDLLLITIDALRFDALNPTDMPFLSSLAACRNACSARQCYAPSSWTAPSLASLLTGLHPHSHRMWMQRMPDRESVRIQEGRFDRTLIDDLNDAGYFTFSFQTNPLGGLTEGVSARFQFYDEQGRTERSSAEFSAYLNFLRGLTAPRRLEALCKFAGRRTINLFEGCPLEYSRAGELLRYGGRDHGEYLVDRVGAFLDDELPGAPAFGWLHFMDPHAPYVPPLRLFPWTTRRHLYPLRYARRYSRSDRRSVWERYRACVRHTDNLLKATLRAHLRRRRRPVLLAVTSDHGEEFWDHGDSRDPHCFYRDGVGHGHTLYQELIHVPLVFYARGMECPVSGPAPCSLTDLRPTLLSAAGIPPQGPTDGRDVCRSRSTPQPAVSEYLYSGPERKAVVDGELKMIAREGGAGPEVYDIGRDPRERQNLADEKSDRLRRIRALWHWLFDDVPFEPVETRRDEDVVGRLQALGYL